MNPFVPLSADNYLAMEVACTLNCPKANQEVVVKNPDGNEMQKCEKCEGDCPKGRSPIKHNTQWLFYQGAIKVTCRKDLVIWR